MIRLDLYFSNWIILWSLLYIFSICDINPYIWCVIVLLVTSIGIIIFIIKKVQFNIILLLIIIVLLPKILLIWCSQRIRNCNNMYNSFIYGLILFIIYNIWLYINKTNLYTFYLNYLKIVLNNNNNKLEMINDLIIYKY